MAFKYCIHFFIKLLAIHLWDGKKRLYTFDESWPLHNLGLSAPPFLYLNFCVVIHFSFLPYPRPGSVVQPCNIPFLPLFLFCYLSYYFVYVERPVTTLVYLLTGHRPLASERVSLCYEHLHLLPAGSLTNLSFLNLVDTVG